jgi:Domain of unknown function (DUF4304)
MQEPLKQLISDLHVAFFKPNGFKKLRHRFRRDLEEIMQEVQFESSSWNSTGAPIRFYVNISVGFADVLMKSGKAELTGTGRISHLVPGAPEQFDLAAINSKDIYADLLALLPCALSELPKHYQIVRSRAQEGWYTPIPLPASWSVARNDTSTTADTQRTPD